MFCKPPFWFALKNFRETLAESVFVSCPFFSNAQLAPYDVSGTVLIYVMTFGNSHAWLCGKTRVGIMETD